MATNFGNSAGNGQVTADSFAGTASAADIAANRASTQPASAPNGLAGTVTTAAQLAAAAGTSSQANATPVLPGEVIVITVTNSTRGIRASVKTTNSRYEIFNDTTTAVLLYPATNCTINALSTNTALLIAAHKGDILFYRNGTHACTIVGA